MLCSSAINDDPNLAWLKASRLAYEANKRESWMTYLQGFDECEDKSFILSKSQEAIMVSLEWVLNILKLEGIPIKMGEVNQERFLKTLRWMVDECQGEGATEDPTAAKLLERYNS